MNRLFTLAITLLMLGILVAPIAAGNHDSRDPDDGPMNKKKCEEMGGHWVNENGVKSCNTWQAVDDDDDIGTDDGVELGEFVAYFPDPDKIDSIERLTQRGNVHAPGTSPPDEAHDGDVIEEFEQQVLRCFRKISRDREVEVSTAVCEALLKSEERESREE